MAPPKRPWLRLYAEITRDRKIRRLQPAHRWLYIAVLTCARRSPVPGVLLLSDDEPLTIEDLSDEAALSATQVTKGLKVLAAGGLIEHHEDFDAWFVPKWNERQFESDDTAKRTAKHRRKNVPSNGHVTHQKTEAEEESEPEKKLISSSTPNSTGVSNGVGDERSSNGSLQAHLVEQGFPASDVAIVCGRIESRQRFGGVPINDPEAWAKKLLGKLSLANTEGEGAIAVIDGETLRKEDGRWVEVES